MDTRTANLLRALDDTSVDVLAVLLEKPLPEKALVQKLRGIEQPHAHKKLRRLGEVGLIRQDPSRTGRGNAWEVVEPVLTAQVLRDLLALSDALDAVDQKARNALRDRMG